jgi:hypothetical protein
LLGHGQIVAPEAETTASAADARTMATVIAPEAETTVSGTHRV